jgi:dTDP-4-amino-4,6-dideoxygalactose transaminase
MHVPLLDLRQQYRPIAAELIARIAEICATQQFVLGRYVAAFEAVAATYCRVADAIGVSSGTDALLLALTGLGIGAGDEVVTSPYTFFATAGTIARTGARPVFCDIDPVTFNLRPSAVRAFLEQNCERRGSAWVNRATGGRVRALMPVHLYGQCADMQSLLELAGAYGLKMIEDAAQAIGADDALGRRAGGIGDVGCLSFFPTKNLGAFGDAGMCTTQNATLAQHLKVLRVHGGEPKYYHSFIGGNFRLDEIQAAVLEIKLPHLDNWTAGRTRNAAFYNAAFAAAGIAGVVTPAVPAAGRHVWNQYVIRVPRRDELKAYLSAQGVGSEIYYPVPLHLQRCFDYLGYRAGDFPEAERAARETLALPIYPELEATQLQYVVDRVAAFYRQ